MAKIALIVLLSFALILSAKPIVGQEEEAKDSAETELGPAPAGDAAEEAADGEEISSDQLKKIGSEVKEAFQNIEDNVNEATSPEQEEQIMEEFAKELAPSPVEDYLAPSSDDVDADVPSSGEADAPLSDGVEESASPGEADAPSSEGGKESSSSGESDAPSPGDDEADSPKDAL